MFAFLGFLGFSSPFELVVLLLQRGVLLSQLAYTILQVATFFNQFRHMGLELFVFLPRFCILAPHHRQNQCQRE